MEANEVLSDPNWLPTGFGPNKTIVFQKFEQGGIADSTFLDSRAKGITKLKVQIAATQILPYAKGIKSETVVNELFHISHVGSTLLAKVVQSVPASISYREPTIFKDMTNRYYDFHSGANAFLAKEMPLLLGAIYALFQRGEFEHIFIKQTSGNLILPVKMAAKSGFSLHKREAFLYTSAKDFISHAVKSQGAVADSVSGAPRRVGYFNRLCTFRRIELADLKPLEKVALIWLTEMQKLNLRSNLSGVNNAINFDACIRNGGKEVMVDTLCQAFDLDEHRDTLMQSPAWESNSKHDEPFELATRTQILDKNYLAHKIDIEKAITWLRDICDENVNFATLADKLE